MRQRQSELTEKRGERLRLRHTAETGIKELESKERQRIKEGEQNHSFFIIHVRQRHDGNHQCLFVHLYSPPWCQNIALLPWQQACTGQKSTLFQKNKQSERALYNSSYAQTRRCTLCSTSDRGKSKYVRG